MKVNARSVGEHDMRLVLLGYAEFVYSAGFCSMKEKVKVKVKNVDLPQSI
jgi:hypothetical protein